jgi:DNA-binding HxlR family transcriptional regulator
MQQVPYVCGLGPAIDVISGKWKALLLWAIAEKPCRFGELKRAVPGITEKMLIQHLRELEADGIVHREVFHEIPPKVVYSATELGASLNKALEPLGAWGDAHIAEISARRQRKAASISHGSESM